MDMVRTRFLAPAWLVLCLLFGGSTTGGVLANAMLQILAIAILVYVARAGSAQGATHAGSAAGIGRPARILLMIVLAAAVAGFVSLLPLPPGLWQHLPGRGTIAEGYALLGMPLPWLPLSLTPDATVATLLTFLPPLAMFLLVLGSSEQGRRATVLALAAFAFASVLFGMMQQVGGYNSDAYLYQFTSRGGVVGFFANRNHLATLCLMTMPFLAALAVVAMRPHDGGAPGRWVPAAVALALMVVGAVVVQSLAGWLLLVPTLLACFFLFRRRRGRGSSHVILVSVAAVLAAAILATLFAPWSTTEIVPVAEVHPQERRTIMALTWEAAKTFFPFGTGAGSFVSVYPRFEDTRVAFTAYVNHAHNDYLELLLEQGAVGILLLGAFLLWWGARIREAWRRGGDPVARAATIAIGVVLAHGVVDYPARTAAIASVVALCCALAASPPAAVADPVRRPRRPGGGSDRTIMLGREPTHTTRPMRASVT